MYSAKPSKSITSRDTVHFRDALIGGGYITPESKNKGFTGHYRALEALLNNEVETAENTQLSITSEPI